MKLGGKKLKGGNIEVVVIPRPDGELVFKAKAVLDYKPFEEICPQPTPPKILLRGQKESVDPNDPDYIKALGDWGTKKSNWMILESLKATEDLEWETVNYSDPETWKNYPEELREAGFSSIEVGRIIDCVINACGLNQDKIDEATERFLAMQREAS